MINTTKINLSTLSSTQLERYYRDVCGPMPEYTYKDFVCGNTSFYNSEDLQNIMISLLGLMYNAE